MNRFSQALGRLGTVLLYPDARRRHHSGRTGNPFWCIRLRGLESLEQRTLLSIGGIGNEQELLMWPPTTGHAPSPVADMEASDTAGWEVADGLSLPPEAQAELELAVQASPPPQWATPYGATLADTSEYMIGDVWVTVVLLESDGTVDTETEDWTQAEINQVKTEIQEGLTWWEDTLATAPAVTPLHDLTFHADFTYAEAPVATGYEPISRPHTDEELWIDDFLDQVGYNSASSYSTDLRTWSHDQRIANNAHWAYTVFVVDSSNDADGKFSDGQWFAYAYVGGPFAVMTYDNGDWGIDDMGQILAHETGHIFYALDEYAGSEPYTAHSGYYNTQNLNAADGHPDPGSRVDSIMAEAALQNPAYAGNTSSPSSLEMIGWKDSDGDGIFDVLDVPLTLTGSGSYNPATGQYEFTGSSSVQVLSNQNPRGLQNDITTNTVDRIQYRLDGGAWTDGNSYGDYATSVAQNVPVTPGLHTIEFRTIFEETGLTSPVWSDTFSSLDFGDAPDDQTTPRYPTLLANDGARHTVIPGFHLGAATDGDADGQPTAGADGDDTAGTPDDEDGVTMVALTRGHTTASLDVFVTDTVFSNRYLDAWIDFNADDDWDDAGEHIFSSSVAAGNNTITFAVPAAAALGDTYARFRLNSSAAGLAPTGAADDGEVEDYKVTIYDTLVIDVGDHLLGPEATDQTVEVHVSGAEEVYGVNFYARIDDGLSPTPTPSPEISNLDVIGDAGNPTIFYGNNNGQSDPDGDPDAYPYYEARFLTTSPAAPPTATADGLLAIITFDTQGVTSGTWDLILSDPGGFQTDFIGAPVTIIDGTITVSTPPVADAGGPYTVEAGGTVVLDGSASHDPEEPLDGIVLYEWDLDGDGVFGETGAEAQRGDELSVSPTFSAVGLSGPATETVSLRVTDSTVLVSGVDTAEINITDVAPVIRVTDSSGAPDDASVQFTTPLSQYRPLGIDSPLVRPNCPDTQQYIDVTNDSPSPLTLYEIQISADSPNVTIDPSLGSDPGDDIVVPPGQTQRFQLAYAPTIPSYFPLDPKNENFALSDGLVILSNATNNPDYEVGLRGVSTFNSDISYDGRVDLGELGVLNSNWGKASGDLDWDPTADIDGNGKIDLSDLSPLTSEFGSDLPLVLLVESDGSSDVVEGGATDTYSLVLNREPTGNVQVAIAPDSQTEVDVTPATFTPGDWQVAQTITVAAIDDSDFEGTHLSHIVHTTSSSDPDYDGLPITFAFSASYYPIPQLSDSADLVVTVEDNDPPPGGFGGGLMPAPGFSQRAGAPEAMAFESAGGAAARSDDAVLEARASERLWRDESLVSGTLPVARQAAVWTDDLAWTRPAYVSGRADTAKDRKDGERAVDLVMQGEDIWIRH